MSNSASPEAREDEPTQRQRQWLEVNAPAIPANLDFSACCEPATSTLSPIDEFYRSQSSIITVGQPDTFEQNEIIGRLMIMGFVACVETYVRDVLSAVALLCPVTKENISEQQVKFGSLGHYGADHYVRGLFEGTSFASASEIMKKSGQFFKLSWRETDELGVAASNYDLVCHVRHAAVHAQGILNQGNLKALRLNGVESGQPQRIVLNLGIVHECASACRSFVRAYNRRAFETVLQTWITKKVLTGAENLDIPKYGKLVKAFRSSIDQDGGILGEDAATLPDSEILNSYTELKPRIVRRMRQ